MDGSKRSSWSVRAAKELARLVFSCIVVARAVGRTCHRVSGVEG